MLFLLAYKNPKVVFKRLWLHFNLGPYWERMVQLWTFVRNPKRLWQWDVAHLPSVLGLFVAGEIFAAKKMVWTPSPTSTYLAHFGWREVEDNNMNRISNGNYQKANKDLLGLKSGNSFLFLFFTFFLGCSIFIAETLKALLKMPKLHYWGCKW